LDKLVWRLHHDEDVNIYLNGVLAYSASGYTTAYLPVTVSETAKAALVQNDSNVIAVHCHQTGGGQYIDVGMAVETVHIPEGNCGQWGYAPADLDHNCQVDIEDLAIFTSDWMGCSFPEQANCIKYLNP